MEIKIKIIGNGSLEEITKELKDVINSLVDLTEIPHPIVWEQKVLLIEIRKG